MKNLEVVLRGGEREEVRKGSLVVVSVEVRVILVLLLLLLLLLLLIAFFFCCFSVWSLESAMSSKSEGGNIVFVPSTPHYENRNSKASLGIPS